MKIAYILTTYPSRSETFAQLEIETMQKQGVHISVLAAGADKSEYHPKQPSNVFYRPARFSFCSILSIVYFLYRYPLGLLKILRLAIKTASESPKEAFSILANLHTIACYAKFLDDHNIHIVHAYFLNWPACIGLAIACATHRKLTLASHARDIFVESGAIETKARFADFIVTCTQQGLDHLKSLLPPSLHHKLEKIHHGIDPPRLPIDLMIKNQPFQLLAIGRLIPKKGFDILIRAMTHVIKMYPHCTLSIAGDGQEREILQQLTTELDLSDHIRFLGWKNPSAVSDLLRSAAILVVPSRIDPDGDRDGIPNVILEAFCVHTPVVATDLDGIREAVCNNETGLLAEPGCIEDLANKIIFLLGNSSAQQRLAFNAFNLLRHQFDLTKNTRTLLNKFNRPPKIVHIVEGFTGGIATYFRLTLPPLIRKGFHITLIYSASRGFPDVRQTIDFLRQNGVTVHHLPMTRNIHPILDPYHFFKIWRFLSRQSFDIVHTHCSKAGALGRLAAVLSRHKIIVHTPHCFAFLRTANPFKRDLYLFLERCLGKLTDRLVAVSHSEAQIAVSRRIIPSTRCKIICNALPKPSATQNSDSDTKNRIAEKYGLPKNKKIVLTVSRLIAYKGIFRLLTAARLSQTPNTLFIIVGCGELQSAVTHSIKNENLDRKVALLGFIPDPQDLYALADLVVVCSDAEGQSFSILEAMQARKTVLATAVPGNQELIIHPKNGLLVEPDPIKLAQMIDFALANDALRTQIGQNACHYVNQYHRLEHQIDKLIALYHSVSSFRPVPFENSITQDSDLLHILPLKSA